MRTPFKDANPNRPSPTCLSGEDVVERGTALSSTRPCPPFVLRRAVRLSDTVCVGILTAGATMSKTTKVAFLDSRCADGDGLGEETRSLTIAMAIR